MQSFDFTLTNNFTELIDFTKLRVRYFNLEIKNFDNNTELVFRLRLDGDDVIRVPNNSTVSRENFPLVNKLYGRAVDGVADISIDYW
jgi:hypothetical protein